MKTCTKCKAEKPLTAFGRCAKAKDGLQFRCRECTSEDNRARYQASPDVWIDAARRFAAAKPERRREIGRKGQAQFRQRFPDRVRESKSRWNRANPDRCKLHQRAQKARRRAGAGVTWDRELDLLVLAEAAALCRLRAAATGVSWQIDHIVPLRCEVACGLHTAINLAVVPEAFNRAKGNLLVPSQRGFVLEARV